MDHKCCFILLFERKVLYLLFLRDLGSGWYHFHCRDNFSCSGFLPSGSCV